MLVRGSLILSLVLFSEASFGHAFGARYDLPLPLNLYLYAAGAAVILSFVVAAFFLRRSSGLVYEVSKFSWQIPEMAVRVMELLSIVILILIIICGFIAEQNPTKNIAATFVWVLWWVGFTFFCAFVGDCWKLLNPWRILSQWIPGKDKCWHYPEWIGSWPAFFLFIVFSWLELISDVGDSPRQLSILVFVYSIFTLFGIRLYGEAVWLKNVEIFTIFFTRIGRFAAAYIVATADGHWQLRIRYFAVRLMEKASLKASEILFVIAMLATVSFDGFLETPAWVFVTDWVSSSQSLRTFLITLQASGVDLLMMIKTLALLLTVGLFYTAFSITCQCMKWITHSEMELTHVKGMFIVSLVPIAIAYHLAHYYSYLLLAGQLIIPQLSDPFSIGWNLFSTRHVTIDISIVNAKFVWYLSVVSIVTGHIIAVWLAHRIAQQLWQAGRQVILSQLPMLILMVGYTMVSLWILSQPIVEQ
jgi:hypothetical protein